MIEALYVLAGVVAAAATAWRAILLRPEMQRWRSARWWARDALLMVAAVCVLGVVDVLRGAAPSAREAGLMAALAVAAVAMAANMMIGPCRRDDGQRS